MKKVIFEEPQLFATFKDFQEMLKYAQSKCKCIGFIPEKLKTRYMLVTGGTDNGLAVNHSGTWTSKENQTTELGEYFMFDSSAELYKWMSE